ncbi:MAG: DEAD/DEAH box helicase [Gammaproteobacteria bacterium]|nr:DEAD/DEAH box helicase [Gammaproteobacteria bacterium]MDH5801104.1 DEAD/DEAH box helicase [Gammaproteobacteria bacterium]
MSAPVSPFSDLGLSAPVCRALNELGYETPSPIQTSCIPLLLEGKDILGQAQTGTGKTAAFALPLLQRLDLNQRQTQLLVLTPTRELALQVAEALQSYGRFLPGFHVLPVYGGQSMGLQLRQLKRGVHVIVGTPGRVMDHMRRKTIHVESLRSVVLDEADEMLKMGFIDDIDWILQQLPQERQMALFSATMPGAIRKVAQKHLHNPEQVVIKADTTTVETIEQRFWKVDGIHKLDALTRILETEEMDAAIVFVRTKNSTVELSQKLEARGFASACLNGDMNQPLREKTVEQLKRGSLDIVVATDVAARGLDVSRITHVFNYDIPYDSEAYVHRIGRTGRAGRNGKAILFAAPREMRLLRGLEKATGSRIAPLQIPTSAEVSSLRLQRYMESVINTVQTEDLVPYEQVVETLKQQSGFSAETIAAALVAQSGGSGLFAKSQARGKTESANSDSVARKHQDEKPKSKFKQKDSEFTPAGRDKPKRDKKKDKKSSSKDPGMLGYRLEVGETHGATARDIVGAIANEAGLDSQYIGRIRIYDNYSTVDLPEGMPKEIFQHLKKVRVQQKPLNISLLEALDRSRAKPRAPAKRERSSR